MATSYFKKVETHERLLQHKHNNRPDMRNNSFVNVRLLFLNLLGIYLDWPIATRQLIYKAVIGPRIISPPYLILNKNWQRREIIENPSMCPFDP
jgi:hypothetical protein